MESLEDLKNLLKKEDFMVKVDLQDAYFTVPLNQKESGNSVRFQWNGNLFEFTCLMFGLGPCPRIFTKLLEVPITILRRLNIRLIIYIDDMLIMGSSMLEILMARDTVISLLEALGFVINYEVCVDTNNSDGVSGNPHQQPNHDISDTTRENEKFSRHVSKDTGLKNHNSQRTSTCSRKVTGNSTSIHPSPLELRHLQRQQRLSLQTNMSCETVITLKREACLVHYTGG